MSVYEEKVIRPLLDAIEKHQEYLTQPENLPQLAKMGFMFEKLWYAGRVAYGCEGTIKEDDYTCENNPKYELGDTITYINEDIENLVYDAWGLHVSNEPKLINFKQFVDLIWNGKPKTEFELKYMKPNKTFDEWVEILTDENYRYSSMYPNKISVANHMLCVYGNGYAYDKKTGFVIATASGAHQDRDIYGDWENSVFSPEIKPVIEQILNEEVCKLAVDAETKVIKAWQNKKEQEKIKRFIPYHEKINAILVKNGEKPITVKSKRFKELAIKMYEAELKKIMSKLGGDKNKKFEYFQMCHYSILTQFDENTHPSYIKVGLEICKEILDNPQAKDFENNKPIAEKFLEKFEVNAISDEYIQHN